jgi:transposase
MTKTMTARQFFKKFSTDEICLEYLFKMRFGENTACFKCGEIGKFHKLAKIPAYTCNCGHHIHPKVGTPFEDSRTPLQLWFYAIYLFTATRSGVSAKELQRQLGVTYKCAWRMGHEIRKHMGSLNSNTPLGGFKKEVEIDEGFFGGENSKKAILLGMVEKQGDIRTKVIPENVWFNVEQEILKNVKKTTTIHTDEHGMYRNLKRLRYDHKPKNHTRDEEYTTPTLDSYWTRLKLSIKGTHVWVSPKYLDKYADEFAYRFNRRFHPERMIDELLSNFVKPSS